MSGSIDLEGVHGPINALDLELAGLPARSPRFQPNEGVLRREMTWLSEFMVFSHCHWVWKGRTDVSERV